MAEAVELATEGNRALAASRARVQATESAQRGSDSFLWPMVGLDAATIRTNDPVGVFGAKLRQGRFTMEDFDIESLNHPDPVTDWSAGVGVRWAILDPSAWAGRDAAGGETDAARLGLQRSEEATVFQTRAHYLAALRAQSRLESARLAEAAAHATAELFRRRASEGVLMEADVLQAEAEVQAAEAGRIHAEQAALDARARLGVFIGWDADVLPVPSDSLHTPDGAGAVPAPSGADLEARSDIRAMEAGIEVARGRASQANRVRLPALEAFGRAAVHSESLSGFEDNWTVGLQLSWPVFTGRAATSGRDQAQALARAAEYEREEALASARAELDEALRGVSSARGRYTATESARDAAEEARRLVALRFDQGMATSVDLLQADARLTDMRARAVDALADYHLAVARLAFVAAIPVSDTPDAR
jgi:outer membrane protein TolC